MRLDYLHFHKIHVLNFALLTLVECLNLPNAESTSELKVKTLSP